MIEILSNNIHNYKRVFIPHNLRATNDYSHTHISLCG